MAPESRTKVLDMSINPGNLKIKTFLSFGELPCYSANEISIRICTDIMAFAIICIDKMERQAPLDPTSRFHMFLDLLMVFRQGNPGAFQGPYGRILINCLQLKGLIGSIKNHGTIGFGV